MMAPPRPGRCRHHPLPADRARSAGAHDAPRAGEGNGNDTLREGVEIESRGRHPLRHGEGQRLRQQAQGEASHKEAHR